MRTKRRSIRKKAIKRKIKLILFVMTILIVMNIGYKKAKNAKSASNTSAISENKEKFEGGAYADEIPMEVINSDDLVIKDLLKMSKDYSQANRILSDITLYPKELLELASKKPEVIDFVSNYPNYEPSLNKKISVKEDYEEGKIPLFIQWDERWGYEKYGSNFIAINGCGPTSLAMVLVGLTGDININPKVMADFSSENGYLIDEVGSSWTLMSEGAEKLGLKSEELPLSESIILNTLKEGQPIIVSMGPGTFTTTGHFVVLTGVDSDNKIIINDSDSKIRSNQTWDIDIFMKEAKNLWTFTPK